MLRSILSVALLLVALPSVAAAQAPDARPAPVPDPCAAQTVTMALEFDLFAGEVAATENARIGALAAHLAACPQLSFELQVHTDTVRSSAFNARASQNVAEHVRRLLGARGIGAARLAACGYGESAPRTGPSWDATTPNTRLVLRALPAGASAHRCPAL